MPVLIWIIWGKRPRLLEGTRRSEDIGEWARWPGVRPGDYSGSCMRDAFFYRGGHLGPFSSKAEVGDLGVRKMVRDSQIELVRGAERLKRKEANIDACLGREMRAQ